MNCKLPDTHIKLNHLSWYSIISLYISVSSIDEQQQKSCSGTCLPLKMNAGMCFVLFLHLLEGLYGCLSSVAQGLLCMQKDREELPVRDFWEGCCLSVCRWRVAGFQCVGFVGVHQWYRGLYRPTPCAQHLAATTHVGKILNSRVILECMPTDFCKQETNN